MFSVNLPFTPCRFERGSEGVRSGDSAEVWLHTEAAGGVGGVSTDVQQTVC